MTSSCGSSFAAGRYADALQALDGGDDDIWRCCNRALANLELELYRACLRECDAALRLDPACLRAYHLRSLALVRMGGKLEEAKATVLRGLEAGEDGGGDMWVYRDLSNMLRELEEPPSTSSRMHVDEGVQQGAGHGGRVAPVSPSVVARQPQKVVGDPLDAILSQCGVPKEVLERVRTSLCFASGVPAVDDGIALGYLKVNTGKYAEALELFGILLDRQPSLLAARLGRGSAFALMGRLAEGVQEFTAAIQIDPTVADSWKRRGQTRSALGDVAGGLNDLNKAIELDPSDVDTYNQRGLVLHKMRDFRRALADLRKVVAKDASSGRHSGDDSSSKVVWNFVALCESNLGNVTAALEAYDKAIGLDGNFKEARLNKAQLLRDMGRGEEALAAFDETLRTDKAYVQGYMMKGMCHYCLGQLVEAAKVLTKGLLYDPTEKGCRHWLALTQQARGLYREAAQSYEQVLALVEDGAFHVAWYHREMNAQWWSRLDRKWRSFNLDAEMDPELKEGWCKGYKPWELKGYKPLPPPLHVPDVSGDLKELEESGMLPDDAMAFLIDLTRPFGRWIQLNKCAGFLSNTRQHRMCGLAALEIAQTVRAQWDSLLAKGMGVFVPDQQSSSSPGPAAGARPGVHPLGWRDVFDIAVRWRQISEPNDPVFWIDRLVPESFADGFGLQTPIVNGQLKVIRYYPYFQRSFKLMNSLLTSQVPGLDASAREMIESSVHDLDTLYSLVKRDFWVVSPCHSRAVPGRVMEGTRLTLVASDPGGYEFTIRTPGTPTRWREYDEELRSLWGQLTEAYCQGEEDVDAISDLIVSIFYYWLPACGVMREGVQLDWEAILSPDPETFLRDAVRPYVYPSLEAFSMDTDWPRVFEVFDTPRRSVVGLCVP